MYAEHAMPMPGLRFFGEEAPPSRLPPCDAAVTPYRVRFSRQSDASTTLSMHSPRPMVVTVRWFAVLVKGSATIRLRRSAGSRPSCSAALSSWHSSANRGWGVPWPRLGPHGGLLVKMRAPSNLYTGILYVTGLITPV